MNHRILLSSATLLFLYTFLNLHAQAPKPDHENVEYALVDDSISLRLDIYLPHSGESAPYPVIVWIHGGGWQSGSKGTGAWVFMLNRGYAIVSINYRLSGQAIFPAQIHDCKGAIRWIRAHAAEYGLDGERIGVFGSSAGGHLVSLLGTSGDAEELEGDVGGNIEYSSRVQAVADWYGPSNLPTMGDYPSNISHNDPDSPEGKLLGGAIPQNIEKAWAASPIAYVSADDLPFLIQHGTEDMTVPYHQSVELDSALRKANVDVLFSPVVGGGHGQGFEADSVRRRVIDFFARTLLGVSDVHDRNVSSPRFTILLSPLPAHDYLTVRLSDPSTPCWLQLIDMMGQTAYEGIIDSGESIDLTGRPAGIYLLKALNKEGIANQTIVVW